MLTSLVFGAALSAPAAPIPRDTDRAPAGPAPWVLYLKADTTGRVNVGVYKTQKVTQLRTVTETVGGKQVTRQVQEQFERTIMSYVALNDLPAKYATVAGTPVSADAVLKRAKDGLVALVSADGKPVERAWLRGVDPDAVVATADGLVGVSALRPVMRVPTQAPRLVMLGTGPDGAVRVAYDPAAADPYGYANAMFAGRANRVVFINNGAGAQPIFLNDDGSYSAAPAPTAGPAPVKPLADVAFDAYDLTGKRVPRTDALARLTAGGLVLVAGENRAPDESYLKLFRGDLLVLVAPELVNVPTGRKGPTAAVPAVGPALALPAIQLRAAPVRLVAPAAVKPGVLRRVNPAAGPAKRVEQAPLPKEKVTG